MAADQVAGDHGEVGMELERRIHHAGEFAFAQKGAEVDVAELQDAQALEVLWQAGQRDIHLTDMEIGALNERAVADRGERRGHERAAGGIEHTAPARVDVRMHKFAHTVSAW